MQELARHTFHRHLRGNTRVGVGLVGDAYDRVVFQAKLAHGHHEPLDRIAVVVRVLVDGDRGLRRPRLGHELVACVGPGAHLDRGNGRSANVVLELAADP